MYQKQSVFQSRIHDPRAVYLAPTGGDDSTAVQSAIDLVADKLGEGVVFVGPGTYTLSRTIYIPTGIRLIGWGKTRPLFRLINNAPELKTPA